MVETESRFEQETTGRARAFLPVFAPAMTRCHCAGLSFEEIARRMSQEGWSLADARERTGCGGMCTACVPDLEQYVASTRRDERLTS